MFAVSENFSKLYPEVDVRFEDWEEKLKGKVGGASWLGLRKF